MCSNRHTSVKACKKCLILECYKLSTYSVHAFAEGYRLRLQHWINAEGAVCSWLPLQDVKECRFVSKMWDDGAIPILKKRSTIRIKCNHNTTGRYPAARPISDLASIGIPDNVEIIIEDKTPNRTLFQATLGLIKEGTVSFKNLKLNGPINTSRKAALLQQLLQGSYRTLTKLWIGLTYWSDDIYLLLPDPLVVKEFNSVQKLDLSSIQLGSYTLRNVSNLALSYLPAYTATLLAFTPERVGNAYLTRGRVIELGGEIG
ncbi:hypothetical protein Fcan01_11309 [Folsomia candida]|uniref:Uncharacterized protein n=1 Tax=Folsomia candida TaxID=158441 RepID=A0A226EBW3_FOLCA|nr:hypothetical protein Fcan01_11309 [Folsomia candida]